MIGGAVGGEAQLAAHHACSGGGKVVIANSACGVIITGGRVGRWWMGEGEGSGQSRGLTVSDCKGDCMSMLVES